MMGNNNKILTVSYGTFSCTLEGFDDSFEMMKAVAEYFRDLAEKDRLFGATPPTPDTALLASLAEKESNQKVAASSEDGRIVLRASDEAPTTVPAAAPAAPIAAAAVGAGIASTQGEAGSIAERLQRIRAVVNQANDEDEAAAPDYSEDQHAEEFGAPVAETPAAETPVADAATFEDEGATETVEAEAEDIPTDGAIDAAEASEDHQDTAEDDSADMDAVDAADETDASEADAVDTNAETDTADVTELDTITDAETDDAEADHDAVELEAATDDATEEGEDTNDEDTLSALLADTDASDADTAHADELTTPDTDENTDDIDTNIEDTLASLLADDELIEDTPSDSATDEDPAEDIEDGDATIAAMMAEFKADTIDFADAEAEADEAPVEADEAQADTLADDTSDTVEEAPAPAVADADADTDSDGNFKVGPFALRNPLRRTRVIKVKRSDFQQAMDAGDIEDIAPTPAPAPVDDTVSSLSEQDEAELMAELAKVEAEEEQTAEPGSAGADALVDQAVDQATPPTDADNAVDVTDETVSETYEDVTRDDQAAAEADDTDAQGGTFETDVNRLMAKAEEAMDEPETAQRRSAFQALKAAVAARKADKDLADDDGQNDSVAYQSDLAEVVQPSRAEGDESDAPQAEAHDAEPAAAPPLRLVAEQRVDSDEVPAATPVVPATDSVADFADYAVEHGATSLPDVLEAAAAYLAFVEGKQQFSRPQLMSKVRMVEKEDFSREDGLRSFGQLLRAGKIEKVAGGRFAVTGDIGYRPDQREAG